MKNSRGSKWLVLITGAVILQCAGSKETNRYAQTSLWLCKPGIEHNYCYEDLTATEILPDGTRRIEEHIPAEDPAFDCFYIYPTVDLTGPVGNHTDFTDVSPMLVPLLNQAARFNKLCAIYAPLYRQVTLATFAIPDPEEYLEIAYSDVLEAFKYYMECCNKKRFFVLMGHSQGSIMLRMLLQREFENNPELKKRLITALLIGGDVLVPKGMTAGETFQSIPICTSVEETGCIIAYRSYAEGYPPSIDWPRAFPEGTDSPCTNPANPNNGEEKTYLSGSYFPSAIDFAGIKKILMPDLVTPFFVYRNYYTARCAKTEKGISYLEIGVSPSENDLRENPLPPEEVPLFSVAGLHMVDYNLMLEDLIKLVEIKSITATGN